MSIVFVQVCAFTLTLCHVTIHPLQLFEFVTLTATKCGYVCVFNAVIY